MVYQTLERPLPPFKQTSMVYHHSFKTTNTIQTHEYGLSQPFITIPIQTHKQTNKYGLSKSFKTTPTIQTNKYGLSYSFITIPIQTHKQTNIHKYGLSKS